MIPYYLLIDIAMVWTLGFLGLSCIIVLFVIVRSFLGPYKDKKDKMHYEGVKQSLVREAETLARGLSCGD